MTREEIKLSIVKIITNNHHYGGNKYEDYLESGNINLYKCVLKVPTSIMILGIVKSFTTKSFQSQLNLLKLLKEVVQDILEFDGIEVSYRDEDWEKLTLVEVPNWNDRPRLELNNIGNDKGYMCNFFEL